MGFVTVLVAVLAVVVIVMESMVLRADRKRRAELAELRAALAELTGNARTLAATTEEAESRTGERLEESARRTAGDVTSLRTELNELRATADERDTATGRTLNTLRKEVADLRQSLGRLEATRRSLGELRETATTHRQALDETTTRLDEREAAHLSLVRALETAESELATLRTAVLTDYERRTDGSVLPGRITTTDEAARPALTDLFDALAESVGLRVGYTPAEGDTRYLFGKAPDLAERFDAQLRAEDPAPELAALLVASFHATDARLQLGPLRIEQRDGQLLTGVHEPGVLAAKPLDLTEWARRQRD